MHRASVASCSEKSPTAVREMAYAGEATGTPHVVRVKRELLEACMTCPICNKLLDEATAISECLHTFCRKCIFEKLADEEVDCCPICNIDLGCVPVEKLRPDHSLQNVRSRIFPLKRRKVEALEIVPSIALPVRRKERSLSSLVVNTPCVTRNRRLIGRRSKAVARKASSLCRLSPIVGECLKKEENNEDRSSSENLSKVTQNRRHVKNYSNSKSSDHTVFKDSVNRGQFIKHKTNIWKPLNCLVEAANRTKALKSSSQAPFTRADQSNGPTSEVNMHKNKVRARRLDAKSRRRRDLRNSAQAIIDAAIGKRERRNCPIWLSLIASFDERVDSALPQIDSSYLRIKDGGLPVSFIQKYLVKKLNLATEAEVEIKCQHQPVNPMLALHNLIDMWVHKGQHVQDSDKVQASVGASAKEFVMVLTYSRRARAP